MKKRKPDSVNSSVLQSIGKQLEQFTLESVIAEAPKWIDDCISRFARQIESHGLDPPVIGSKDAKKSLLDRLALSADE